MSPSPSPSPVRRFTQASEDTHTVGYRDRINHALAFAAKHHDQQVRRGLRPPYLTQSANIAIILTRYGQGDDSVIAGILLNVVEDYVRAGFAPELIQQRIADKFGDTVLSVALGATPRRLDDAGVELSPSERRADFLKRLASAEDRERWVVAAAALHNAATTLADLQRTVDSAQVWQRSARGKEGLVATHRELLSALRGGGFTAPIVDELADVVRGLEDSR